MDATYPFGLKPLGFEQITVSTTVKTLAVPENTKRATLHVEAQPLRYRLDGTNPDANTGVLVKADVSFDLYTEALKAFKAIRQGGSDATLTVHYFG